MKDYPSETDVLLCEIERPFTQNVSITFARKIAELCRIYFKIASECIGEDEVRKRRDYLILTEDNS